VKRYNYLALGKELSAATGLRTAALGHSGGDGVRQQFIQKERDVETGLDYFGARYFASTQERFSSVDPVNAGVDVRKPSELEGYAYAISNPVKYQDPDGLKVRICGTDGQCTYAQYDLSNEDLDKYFRNQERYPN
jgi:RHS repeat-associated protein